MEKAPRCRHRHFLASVTDPRDSAVFSSFSVRDPLSLCGFQVSSSFGPCFVGNLFQPQTPVLQSGWLVVWGGHSEAWDRPVLWRHAEENLPSPGKALGHAQ